MANSLQDQFLKAGLVDKKKANKVKQQKHKQKKQKVAKGTVVVDENKLLAQKAMEEKAERDRELNRQKKEEEERKAIAGQIRQLISMNAQARDNAEIAYNFSDAGVVKKIYVTEVQQQQIISGRLTIVRLDESYELVPSIVAEKIKQRDDSYIILQNDKDSEVTEQDDPYADYQVPDDLMW
ncbi:MAG: DUF2058 domain-containing protein [Gammaproteobacteria bacterium]|nr:DUF2058 domain-containing protein [Gammaproteobacteria bacterium]